MMKLKCYQLLQSMTFPKTHPKQGEKTGFKKKIRDNIKIHTIRKNYILWKSRIREIEKGTAYLSVREWNEKPYRSRQVEIFRFYNAGIEKLHVKDNKIYINDFESNVTLEELAKNDGLTYEDFQHWFKEFPEEPMAIIHYTKFRYSQIN